MDIRRWLPRRPRNAHKGSCGRVYILAGSRGMVGAGVLASWGAVQAGAGLARLGTVRSQQRVAARRVPLEVTTDALPENKWGQLDVRGLREIKNKMAQFAPDIVALGPGLGVSSGTRRIVETILAMIRCSFVLDADGLNVFSNSPRAFSKTNPVVITPHPGELGRLFKKSAGQIQRDREKFARQAARKFHCVCLLKGPRSLVTDGDKMWRNPSGNSAMASAGMGDVLTGVIAGLWGQMPKSDLSSGFQAAVLGAYLHGRAGDMAIKKTGGLSVRASQVAEFIPLAIKNLKRREI